MERNQIIKLTCYLLKIAMVLLSVGIVATIFFTIHWNIYPNYYKDFQLLSSCDGSLGFIWNSGTTVSNSANFVEMKQSIVNFMMVKTLLVLCCWLFITKQLLVILKSMDTMETFQSKNVKGFRQIAFGVLAILFAEIFKYKWEDGTGVITLGFDFFSLIIALFFFVLAEIFKEGNQLFEEQKYTI